MKKVCILGSTGSIGCSTLNVIRNNKNLFKVEVLVIDINADKIKYNFKDDYLSIEHIVLALFDSNDQFARKFIKHHNSR